MNLRCFLNLMSTLNYAIGDAIVRLDSKETLIGTVSLIPFAII